MLFDSDAVAIDAVAVGAVGALNGSDVGLLKVPLLRMMSMCIPYF